MTTPADKYDKPMKLSPEFASIQKRVRGDDGKGPPKKKPNSSSIGNYESLGSNLKNPDLPFYALKSTTKSPAIDSEDEKEKAIENVDAFEPKAESAEAVHPMILDKPFNDPPSTEEKNYQLLSQDPPTQSNKDTTINWENQDTTKKELAQDKLITEMKNEINALKKKCFEKDQKYRELQAQNVKDVGELNRKVCVLYKTLKKKDEENIKLKQDLKSMEQKNCQVKGQAEVSQKEQVGTDNFHPGQLSHLQAENANLKEHQKKMVRAWLSEREELKCAFYRIGQENSDLANKVKMLESSLYREIQEKIQLAEKGTHTATVLKKRNLILQEKLKRANSSVN